VPITFACSCGKQLRVKDELAGKKVRCPGCQQVVQVPGGSNAAPVSPIRAPAGDVPAPRKTSPIREEREEVPPRRRAPAHSDEDEDAPRPRRRARPPEEDEGWDDQEAGDDLPPVKRPPKPQLVLRIIVLVLAVLGAGVSGWLFFRWLGEQNDEKLKTDVELQRGVIKAAGGQGGPRIEEMKKNVEKWDSRKRTLWLMLAATVLGIAGGVIAFLRLGSLGGLVLLLGVVGPGIAFPPTLLFLSLLIIAGGLAFLIKRGPKSAPRRRPRVALEGGEE
jgi:hypothetical protein